MATPSNLTLTGPQLVFEMLNRLNPAAPKGAFTADNVTLGNPATLSGDISGRNSSLLITAVPGHGYLDTRTIKYNRLDIRQVLIAKGFPAVNLILDNAASSVDLLALINSTYGLNIAASDIVVEALPAADDSSQTGQISYTLKMAATGLAYTGTLPLTVTPSTIQVSRAMRMNVLNGFVPPDTTLINLASAMTGDILNCFTVAMLTAPDAPSS